jgi:signal transduction histidine kinase
MKEIELLQARQMSKNQSVQANPHAQAIREEERARIAREIHDELAQLLTAIKLEAYLISGAIKTNDVVVTEQISRMVSLVNDASRAVERIAADLRPGILKELGLVKAIQVQTREFEKRSGIASKVEVLGNLNLPVDRALNMFRIYQEALTNIARHSKATHVNISIWESGDDVAMAIDDDGRGFDLEKALEENSLGLIGMKERALELAGELNIETTRSRGTKITLRVPRTV